MNVTGFWSAIGLIVMGVILADLIIHPQGTNALGQQIVNTEKVTTNALLGQTS